MTSAQRSRGTVRRRRWVIGVWLLVAAVSAPLAFRVQRELEVTVRIPGSEAGEVERALTSTFASPFARHALLVASGVPSPDSLAGLEVLGALIVAVDAVPGVTKTLSYLDFADTLFLGAQQRGTYVLVGIDAARRPDVIVPLLRETTARVADSLRATHPALTLRWTGEVPINYDLRRTSGDDARRAELRVLPLTLALLLAAFAALVAAALPLAAGALAIIVALGIAAVVNRTWPLSILLQNTVSMIGLGVGIDYALLTVSRFREAVARGASPDDAAAMAARHSGRAIALSGATVMVGFAALLLVPVNEIQSTGIAGIVVVTVSVLIATTLLPEVLALLGDRIERGRFFLKRADMKPRERRWRSWGTWVVTHPWRVLLLAGAPVVLLSWQALRMKSQLPHGNWLPANMESARGAADLAAMRRDGIVNSLRVIIEFPPGTTVFDSSGWTAIRRLTSAVSARQNVARAQSITTLVSSPLLSRALFTRLPEAVRRSLVSPDGRAAVVEVVVSGDADFNDAIALTRAIRGLDPAAIGGIPGTRLRVGGLAAVQADYVDVIHTHANTAILLVLGLTLIVLMFGFRSVIIPIKAVALNLLSVAAAFGAVVVVFQDGIGARLIGLDAPLPGVFPAIPILVFCIVFGLSMDYEVFLVARVAEARREMSDADAIVEGLAKTGGVITSAAAIMIAVFGAFALGDFLFIKMLGFALVVAVLVDATLVRMAIGPALLRLGGRWNWWPRA
jgi:putative drug exporter of the RND superfamily